MLMQDSLWAGAHASDTRTMPQVSQHQHCSGLHHSTLHTQVIWCLGNSHTLIQQSKCWPTHIYYPSPFLMPWQLFQLWLWQPEPWIFQMLCQFLWVSACCFFSGEGHATPCWPLQITHNFQRTDQTPMDLRQQISWQTMQETTHSVKE